MPLYLLRCLADHETEHFVHAAADLGTRTVVCETCGETMSPRFAVGTPLLFFEEGRSRIIHNLGHDPVEIRTPAQHRAAMRNAGVEPAGQRRGVPGWWV